MRAIYTKVLSESFFSAAAPRTATQKTFHPHWFVPSTFLSFHEAPQMTFAYCAKKIRRAVTGKLGLFRLSNTFFFNLYTNNISHYSVRKWENQLKNRPSQPNAFCEANINSQSIPFGLFTEWTVEETSTRKIIPIQTDYYQEPLSDWLHFDSSAALLVSVSSFRVVIYSAMKFGEKKDREKPPSWRIFCLIKQSMLQKPIEIRDLALRQQTTNGRKPFFANGKVIEFEVNQKEKRALDYPYSMKRIIQLNEEI